MHFFSARRSGVIAVAATLVFAVLAFTGTSPATAGKVKCTIKGTKGPDRLVGTQKRDVICGFGGNDVIVGRGGNDVIHAGAGNDVVRGGRGNDVILGGSGNDRLLGQPNNDRLYGGRGNDYLDGGPGRNYLATGPGKNNKCVDKATDTVTPGCDDTPPAITGLESTAQVDTSSGAQTVTITLQLTDDLAGLQGNPSVEVSYMKTYQRRWASFSRISGNAMNGTYQGTVTLPRFSPQGRWDLYVSAVDNQDNHLNAGTAALTKLGVTSGFDQVGAGDEAGPEFKSFEIDKTTIDTSASGQTVNFRARVTDEVAGVGTPDGFRPVEVILIDSGPSGEQRQANNMELVSGNGFDGIYEGSMHFSQGSPAGTWNVRLGAIDFAGNMTLVNHEELAGKGFPFQIGLVGSGS